MSKSSGFRRIPAFMAALLLTLTFAGGAHAQAGAAAARAVARVFGSEASAVARAGSVSKGLLEADVIGASSISRPNLGAIGAIGSGDILASTRPSDGQLSLRGTEALLPDAALAKLCQGDSYASKALAALVFSQSRYHSRVTADREDLAQDTMVRLLEACAKLLADPSINAPRYLSRVMQHAAADSYAKRPDASVVSMSDPESADGIAAANVADPWPDPAARVELRDLIKKVWSKTVLSARQAQVLRLVASGYSRDEVALMVGASEERVKELLAEGRARLRTTAMAMGAGSMLSLRGAADKL